MPWAWNVQEPGGFKACVRFESIFIIFLVKFDPIFQRSTLRLDSHHCPHNYNTTFLAPLFVLSWSARHCFVRAINSEAEQWIRIDTPIVWSNSIENYGKRLSLKNFLMSQQLHCRWLIIDQLMWLASGQSLAWHRVPFPVYTRHVASQADGQGPLSVSYIQCIQQINFDKN